MGTQGFNRYSYAGNNPLKYTDPSGEFIVEAMMIGAFANTVIQGWTGNAQTPGDFFKAGAIGAVAGGLSAGAGLAVTSLLSPSIVIGTLYTPYIVSAPKLGFVYGFASGATGGFVGGFSLDFGNSYFIDGTTGGEALARGLSGGLDGAFRGGFGSGISSGLAASASGRRFWDGAMVVDEEWANFNLPKVKQNAKYNCSAAVAECNNRSLGGNLTQNEARAWVGGDPNSEGVRDIEFWDKYQKNIKSPVRFESTQTKAQVAAEMKLGLRVAVTLNNYGDGVPGHSVALNSVTYRTVVRYSGRTSYRYLFTAMDPEKGTIVRFITFARAKNFFYFYP